MSLLHSRCESLEAQHQALIRELREELIASQDRERQLFDLLLAVFNPDAARLATQMRSVAPAQAIAGLQRATVPIPRTGPQPIPRRPQEAPGSRPLLTPEQAQRRGIGTVGGSVPAEPVPETS